MYLSLHRISTCMYSIILAYRNQYIYIYKYIVNTWVSVHYMDERDIPYKVTTYAVKVWALIATTKVLSEDIK